MKTLGRHVIIITTLVFSLSFLLHSPLFTSKVYDDISYFWITRPETHGYQTPYMDYNFEYPVISGLILYLSSQWHSFLGYYVTMSLVTLVFVMTSICILNKVFLTSNQPRSRIIYYVALTPVFVVYSIYSFDWIGVGFLLLSVYFGHHGKNISLSGMFMGLAIATRIIPIVCIPFILREFKSWREKSFFLGMTATAWLASNIYFMLKNFNGFLYAYAFQNSWHVEDSWMIVFGLDFPGRQYISLGLLIPLLVFIYFRRRLNVWESCFLALLAFMMTSYKFPPQYMILLLPFFALVRTNYSLFIVSSVLDALIILLLPTFQAMGVASWYISSPVQWIAILRQVLLIPIFIIVFKSGKHNETISKKNRIL